MTVTVSGVLARRHGHAVERDDWGIVGHHGLDTDDLAVAAHIPVDVDHDGIPVGHVIHLERNQHSADIWAVAILDDADDIAALAERTSIYWSGQYEVIAAPGSTWIGRQPRLIGAALTYDPASVGLPPVRFHPGDIRHRNVDTGHDHRHVLRRAADHTRTCEQRDAPLRLHHGADPPPLHMTPAGWAGRPAAATAIQHRTGRILSVNGHPVHRDAYADEQYDIEQRRALDVHAH